MSVCKALQTGESVNIEHPRVDAIQPAFFSFSHQQIHILQVFVDYRKPPADTPVKSFVFV